MDISENLFIHKLAVVKLHGLTKNNLFIHKSDVVKLHGTGIDPGLTQKNWHLTKLWSGADVFNQEHHQHHPLITFKSQLNLIPNNWLLIKPG